MTKTLDEILKEKAVKKHMEWAENSNAHEIIRRMIGFLNPSKKVKEEDIDRIIKFLCEKTKIFE